MMRKKLKKVKAEQIDPQDFEADVDYMESEASDD